MFAENLTTEGLREEGTRIGDLFRIGVAVVTVPEPRIPCCKVALGFGRDDMVKPFLETGRSGSYFAAQRKQMHNLGGSTECIGRNESRISVADINQVYLNSHIPFLNRLTRHEAPVEGLRTHFLKELLSLQA